MYRSPIPPSLVAPYCRIGRSQGQYRFTKHETPSWPSLTSERVCVCACVYVCTSVCICICTNVRMYRSPIPPSLVAPYCRIGRSQGQYRFTKHETLYAQTHTPGILHLAQSHTSGHRRWRNTRTQHTHTHTHSPRRATFSTTPAAVPSPPIDRPTDRPRRHASCVCVSLVLVGVPR